MNNVNKDIEALKNMYLYGYRCESLYFDKKRIESDFQDEFKRYAKNEILHADIEIYGEYIMAAVRDIEEIYSDAFKRYRVKSYLEKNFFEKFPKYKFLQKYDLSNYSNLCHELNFIEKMRKEILRFISLIEKNIKSNDCFEGE